MLFEGACVRETDHDALAWEILLTVSMARSGVRRKLTSFMMIWFGCP